MTDLVIDLTGVLDVEEVHPTGAGGAVQDDVGASSPEVVTEKDDKGQNKRTNVLRSRPVHEGLKKPERRIIISSVADCLHFDAVHIGCAHRLGVQQLAVGEEVTLTYYHKHRGDGECCSLDEREEPSEGRESSFMPGSSIVRPHVLCMWRMCLRLFGKRGGQDGETSCFDLADIERKRNDDNVSERGSFLTNLFHH